MIGCLVFLGCECLSCYECSAKDIDTCIKDRIEVDCTPTKNGCYYQESENYLKHTAREVKFGCGRTYSFNGCDVRMGVFKCVKWCKENYCNKNMVRPVFESRNPRICASLGLSCVLLLLWELVQWFLWNS